MNDKERGALNRRVAEAFGYSWWAVKKSYCTDFFFNTAEKAAEFPEDDDEVIERISEDAIDGMENGVAVANWCEWNDYCGDPAAADLVRQEIERRGWDWWVYRKQGTYSADVEQTDGGAEAVWEFSAESKTSPHEALCLAFLAAVDAQEARP